MCTGLVILQEPTFRLLRQIDERLCNYSATDKAALPDGPSGERPGC